MVPAIFGRVENADESDFNSCDDLEENPFQEFE